MASIKKQIERQVYDKIEDTVEAQGVELLEVRYLKEDNRWILRIIIDRRGGVDLEACEKVSRAIDPLLEDVDKLNKAYYLEVQSPGIDRPLTTQADFARYKGADVELTFYKAQDGQKKLQGVLLDNSPESLKIETEEGEQEFSLSDIAKVKRVIDF